MDLRLEGERRREGRNREARVGRLQAGTDASAVCVYAWRTYWHMHTREHGVRSWARRRRVSMLELDGYERGLGGRVIGKLAGWDDWDRAGDGVGERRRTCVSGLAVWRALDAQRRE